MDKHIKGVVAGLVTALTITGAAALPAQAAPNVPEINPDAYSALGDSFAAGVGSGRPINDMGQTRQAYPVVLAGNLKNVNFLAVTGATTADLGTQIAQIPETTEQVTLTVGGNDLNFVGATEACLTSAAACAALGASLPTTLGTMSSHLAMAITAIEQQAPHAEIYVTGYPLLFQAAQTVDNTGVCVAGSTTVGPTAPLLVLPESRTDAIDAATMALNTAITNVVAGADAVYQDVTYVDVATEFTGHGVCGTLFQAGPNPETWIQPVRVSASGVDLTNGPLHPTARGQRAYAEEVLAEGFASRVPANS